MKAVAIVGTGRIGANMARSRHELDKSGVAGLTFRNRRPTTP